MQKLELSKLLLSHKRISLGALAGVMVVLLFGILMLTRLGDNGKSTTHPTANVAVTPTATIADATATVIVTQVATATQVAIAPTATPKPHPLPVPHNAPPPVHNGSGAPPQGIPPTQPTATPCHAATTCVNPNPGPCQPGGQPYYLTPTVTPTTATIAQAISSAASRNGVPVPMQEAIAWQESGWQQNVVACDGGIGLMQVMPTTAAWLNSYYGKNNNVYDLNGNAAMGAGYLSFYYSYYTNYLQQNSPSACGGGGCNWDTIWPGSVDAGNPQGTTVRAIVISVYNEGAGTMANYGIINWSYVSNVLLFYHDRYGGTGN